MADLVNGAVPLIPRWLEAPSEPVSTHGEIESWLTEVIETGRRTGTPQPGDKLPSMSALQRYLGVSRMTLHHALTTLEDRGTIVRRRGRSGGTFVAQPQIECDLTGLPGFTEQMRRNNLHPRASIVHVDTLPAKSVVAEALKLESDAHVHEVVRVRTANSLPVALERAFFPAAVFPDLLACDLHGSIYELMRRRGHEPFTADEKLDPIIASQEDGQLLEVEPGAPLTLIERTAFTGAGRPVEFAWDQWRPDRVRITVRTGVGQAAARRGVIATTAVDAG